MSIAHQPARNPLPPFSKGGGGGGCDATMSARFESPLTPLFQRGGLVWWEVKP